MQSVHFGSGLGPLREPAGALERTTETQQQILPGVKPYLLVVTVSQGHRDVVEKQEFDFSEATSSARW